MRRLIGLPMNITMKSIRVSIDARFPIAWTAKSVVWLGACLLGGCLLTGCSGKTSASTTTQAAETSSGLVCTDPNWNLGEVLVKGEAVPFDHTFVVENRSEKTIQLGDVTSSCGCLVAEGYARTIPPRGRTEIKVTISVYGPPGRFDKLLTVKEDSPSRENISLTVVGARAVSSLLSCSPATIHFGTMTPNESKTKHVFISRYDGSLVNFLGVQTNSVSLAGDPVHSKTVSQFGASVDLVELPIRLQLQSQPIGSFKSMMTIQTKSPDKSTETLEIPIEATIVEETSGWVRSIFVERLERGASVERSLVDDANQAELPRIASISYEGDDSLRVELVEASPAGESSAVPTIRISRPHDSAAEGLVRGALQLQTERSTDAGKTVIGISAYLPK